MHLPGLADSTPSCNDYSKAGLCPVLLQVRHLVVAGGVAANRYVGSRLTAVAAEGGLELVCPPPRLCTDNGVMVAWAGVER